MHTTALSVVHVNVFLNAKKRLLFLVGLLSSKYGLKGETASLLFSQLVAATSKSPKFSY